MSASASFAEPHRRQSLFHQSLLRTKQPVSDFTDLSQFAIFSQFFSEREYAVAGPSVVCLSSVGLTFVRPTPPVEIFGSVSTPFRTWNINRKFYGDRPVAFV